MAINSFFGQFRFLSNFVPVSVSYDGLWFSSVEAAYQAAKTLDERIRSQITGMTASEAKAAGRALKLRPGWEEMKQGIMLDLLRQKFAQSPWRELLLQTGDEELTEGNTWNDTYWGVCRGKGENHLGKMLMQVRLEIQHDLLYSSPYSSETDRKTHGKV